MSAAPAAFDADYLDGRSSRRHAVRVEVQDGTARIRGDDVALDLPLAELRAQPRLGGLPLRIELPGGAVLVADAGAVAGAMPLPKAAGVAHRLESHLGAVLVSLAGVAVAAWFTYTDGIPWLAREVAQRVPPELETQIAGEGLKTLDAYFFEPSKLGPDRRGRITAVFAQLSASAGGAARDARLEFRDGDMIGANALAIPGGVVVVTDQLANLLDDERVAAVLAHELGHLEHRHGARHILQDTIAGLVLLAVFGDASAVATVAATVPTVIMNNGYSRDFEREADRRAYDLLKRTGRSPRLMGEALAALEKEHERERDRKSSQCWPEDATGRGEVEEGAPPEQPRERTRRSDMSYISTHPATEERIRAAEAAALEAPQGLSRAASP